MSKNELVKAQRYSEFVKAQKWAKKNPLNAKERKLLRHVVDTKVQKALKSELSSVPDLYVRLLAVFGQKRGARKGVSVSSAALQGLAYPSIVYFCEICGQSIKLLGATYCSKKCDHKGRYEKSGKALSKKRAQETEQEKKKRAEAARVTSLANWGVENPMKSAKVQKRASDAFKARTTEQKIATREKTQNTLSKKFGSEVTNSMDVPYIRTKAKKNLRKAYAERNEEIQALRKENSLREHGVTHHIHRKEIRDRIQRYQRKTTTIGGVKYTYQGFEDHLIRYLHERAFRVTVNASGIDYVDDKGKARKYYPDMYAKVGDTKLVLEVKSTYTFSWTKRTCPEKFWAGTYWSQSRGADYVVAIIKPGSGKMLLFVNPKRLSDLKKEKGQLRYLINQDL